jgi:hypothetical protein
MMRKSVGNLRMRAATVCFAAWVAWTAEARHVRHKYASRWMLRVAHKILVAWAATARKEARVRLRMRAMSIRMSRRTEVMILQEWRAYVAEVSSMARSAARLPLLPWLPWLTRRFGPNFGRRDRT